MDVYLRDYRSPFLSHINPALMEPLLVNVVVAGSRGVKRVDRRDDFAWVAYRREPEDHAFAPIAGPARADDVQSIGPKSPPYADQRLTPLDYVWTEVDQDSRRQTSSASGLLLIDQLVRGREER